ncbi:MAG: putative 3-deoxy-manno-octulosonate cytidylyltransferase [Streblomastix strix]|uniref:Putative 3-deoxy-manno-octulosonate cytidylyltransferase n=1 Tax=Streblomastix strix TaxID=222440 RepID=A0A5J4UN19_9EUKA|nr:MAG: putative 3-deoxy-manno-octulosonate cytidylyltransferase [Streblomastix strix]
MTTRFIAIIPARYASKRLEGKPLKILGGKTIIQRVYEQAATVFDDVYIATSDTCIETAAKKFTNNVVLTSSNNNCGTECCNEAYGIIEKIEGKFDVVVNVQGDEPFIQPEQLRQVMGFFSDPSIKIATLSYPFAKDTIPQQLKDFNSPKVILHEDMYADNFLRVINLSQEEIDKIDWAKFSPYQIHIGVYAFRSETLKEVASLPKSSREIDESLEQLRWIDKYRIKVGQTNFETLSINTQEQLEQAEEYLKRMKK